MDEFLGFNIYLHDRGQFWPGLEMDEYIHVPPMCSIDSNERDELVKVMPIADPMCFQAELG